MALKIPPRLQSCTFKPFSTTATNFSQARRCLPRAASRAMSSRTSSRSQAASRLSQISRHFNPDSSLPLNTPYSNARYYVTEEEFDGQLRGKQYNTTPRRDNTATTQRQQPAMSKQEPHPTVLIPGPVEFDDEVLKSMSHYR